MKLKDKSRHHRRQQWDRVSDRSRIQRERRAAGDLGTRPEDPRRGGRRARQANVSLRGDVRKVADLEELFARTEKSLGKVDVLVACAGVAKFAPLAALSEPSSTSSATSTSRAPSSRYKKRCRTCAMAARSS